MEKKIIRERVEWLKGSWTNGEALYFEFIEAELSRLKAVGVSFITIEEGDGDIFVIACRERLETDNELKKRTEAENERKCLSKEDDIATLKRLIQRHGKEEVEKIIDSLK